MLPARWDSGGAVTLLPPAPPPPPLPPAPPPAVDPAIQAAINARAAAPPPPPTPAPGPTPAPAPAASEPRNTNGETLAQAEAAVLAEVQAGALGADALARHPLPPGTSSAEALRFLGSLPQTTYVLGQPGGTVTGPPVNTVNPPADPSVDLTGAGGDRETESAYRPPGVVAQWRNLVDVFRTDVPKQHAAIDSVNKVLLGVFK